MDKKRLQLKLLAIKVEVTQLGMKVVQSKMPISFEDAGKEMEPFINIENVIEIEIQKLKSRV